MDAIKSANPLLRNAQARPILFGLVLMGVSALALFFWVKSLLPPPEIITRYRLEALKNNICQIIKSNPSAQISLPELPEVKKQPSLFRDGWNNEIHYQKTGEHSHRLLSYGADGLPSGKHDFVLDFKG